MRAIEDFLGKNGTKCSQPAKGAFHKLNTICDDKPKELILQLRKEFEEQSGQVARDWKDTEAAIKKHLKIRRI